MPQPFQVIGILGSTKNPSIRDTLLALIEYLSQQAYCLLLAQDIATTYHLTHWQTIERSALGKHCDVFIVVGGDGSLLDAVPLALQQNTPLFGINRGRLGFLTDIRPTELHKIRAMLTGAYTIEQRFLLTAAVEQHGKILMCGDALNEVSLTPGSVPHMYTFEIYIDEQFVCGQDADGLIIATPTGSTAYALSGGGPILHPMLDAMVIVPMFPHTLSMRPLVLGGNQTVKVIITSRHAATPRLSCDSQLHTAVPPGSQITVAKKTQALQLVHPLDYNYYDTLRSKLHWGHKLTTDS